MKAAEALIASEWSRLYQIVKSHEPVTIVEAARACPQLKIGQVEEVLRELVRQRKILRLTTGAGREVFTLPDFTLAELDQLGDLAMPSKPTRKLSPSTRAALQKATHEQALDRWRGKHQPAAGAQPSPPLSSQQARTADDYEVQMIEVGRLLPSPSQTRQSFEVAELAESIKAAGLQQPLLVRPVDGGKFFIVFGERRLRAAKLIGMRVVPCYVRELDDRAALELTIIENLQRQDITAFEEALGYEELMKPRTGADGQKTPGLTAQEIAARIGKSPRYVWQSLNLVKLPDHALEDLRQGRLSKSQALELAALPSEAQRKQAVKALRGWDGNYPTVIKIRERLERDYRRELKGACFSQTDKTLLPGVSSCKDCPLRTGNNRELYPDGRVDVCTDPSCFARKEQAHRARALSQLAQDGRAVISGKEADKIIGYGREISWDVRDKWVKADSVCPDDKQRRKWSELVGTAARRTIVENKTGERIEVYALAEVVPLVAQQHGVPVALPDTPEDKVNQAQRRKETLALHQRAAALGREEFRQQVGRWPLVAALRILVAALADVSDHGALFLKAELGTPRLVRLLAPDNDGEPLLTGELDWEAPLAGLPAQVLVELAFGVLVADVVHFYVRDDEDEQPEHSLFDRFGLNWQEIVAQSVRADSVEQAEAA